MRKPIIDNLRKILFVPDFITVSLEHTVNALPCNPKDKPDLFQAISLPIQFIHRRCPLHIPFTSHWFSPLRYIIHVNLADVKRATECVE